MDAHDKTLRKTSDMIKESYSDEDILKILLTTGMYKSIGGFHLDGSDFETKTLGFIKACRRIINGVTSKV